MATTFPVPLGRLGTVSGLERALGLLPIPLALGFLAVRFALPGVYAEIIQEDALLENLQAATYALAAGFAAAAAVRLSRARRRALGALHALFACTLVFVALEETSWGQRAFGLPTIDWFVRHNVQGEMTVHNLAPVQPWLHGLYVAVGLYGGLAWLFVPRNGLPPGDWRRFAVAGRRCSLWFLAVAATYLLLDWASPGGDATPGLELTWRDQEPAETMLSLGLLMVAAGNLGRARELRPDACAL